MYVWVLYVYVCVLVHVWLLISVKQVHLEVFLYVNVGKLEA